MVMTLGFFPRIPKVLFGWGARSPSAYSLFIKWALLTWPSASCFVFFLPIHFFPSKLKVH